MVGWVVAGGGAGAEPITLDGLTFSDELGGVRLEQGSGTGSLADPFVLVEEITGDGPAILIVRGMTHRFGNRVGSHHDVGFALTKTVRNGTGQPWSCSLWSCANSSTAKARSATACRSARRPPPADRSVPTASPRRSRPPSRSTASSSSLAWSRPARA